MAAKLSGGGGGKFDLGQNSDMNVTPFVDVMLVLLIIFMVVAPLATVSVRIDLPPATPPKDDKSKPPTFISIQDSGQIFVSFGKSEVRPSSMDRLSYDLAASLSVPNPTNERIFIRADRHVKYRQFMEVINQLQQDGYYKIGLIAENLGGG
jgi:biopolymer transport protein ExbD